MKCFKYIRLTYSDPMTACNFITYVDFFAALRRQTERLEGLLYTATFKWPSYRHLFPTPLPIFKIQLVKTFSYIFLAFFSVLILCGFPLRGVGVQRKVKRRVCFKCKWLGVRRIVCSKGAF